MNETEVSIFYKANAKFAELIGRCVKCDKKIHWYHKLERLIWGAFLNDQYFKNACCSMKCWCEIQNEINKSYIPKPGTIEKKYEGDR